MTHNTDIMKKMKMGHYKAKHIAYPFVYHCDITPCIKNTV